MAEHHEHKHNKGHFHDHSQALEFDQRAAQSDIRARLVPKLIEALELKGGESVLDLATGTGRIARHAATLLKGGRIIGLDEALAMLRIAKDSREAIPGFFPIAGTAEAFPFQAGCLDHIFTAFAFHHFEHLSLALREAHRVLRPKGRFAVLDPVVANAEDDLDRRVHERVNQIVREAYGGHFHYYSANDIRDLLAEAGFRVVRVDLHVISVDQEGAEGIPTGRHWLEVAEQMQGDPADLRRRFEEKHFRCERQGEKVRVRGRFFFAVVCGEKS